MILLGTLGLMLITTKTYISQVSDSNYFIDNKKEAIYSFFFVIYFISLGVFLSRNLLSKNQIFQVLAFCTFIVLSLSQVTDAQLTIVSYFVFALFIQILRAVPANGSSGFSAFATLQAPSSISFPISAFHIIVSLHHFLKRCISSSVI
jgi:hypothetical protein